MPGNADPPTIKDEIEQVTTTAGAIALLSPALAVLIRMVAFGQTDGIGLSPRLAASLPAAELGIIGILASIPVVAALGIAVLGLVNVRRGVSLAALIVIGGLFIVLVPPFPGTILQLGLSVIGLLLMRTTAKATRSLRSVIPLAVVMVLAAGVTFGITYRGEQAAEYRFDDEKSGAIADGWYSRFAADGDFIYLRSCVDGGVVGVAKGAVLSVDIPGRAIDPGPNLLAVLGGEPWILGLQPRCP